MGYGVAVATAFVAAGAVIEGVHALVLASALRRPEGREAIAAVLNGYGASDRLWDEVERAVRAIERAGQSYQNEATKAREQAKRKNETADRAGAAQSGVMDTAAAADLLDLTVRRVQQLARAGLIGRKVAGRYRFAADELIQFRKDDAA